MGHTRDSGVAVRKLEEVRAEYTTLFVNLRPETRPKRQKLRDPDRPRCVLPGRCTKNGHETTVDLGYVELGPAERRLQRFRGAGLD